MQQEHIQTEVADFIRKNFIFSDTKKLNNDESLLGSGVVDSTGILELIAFLEGKFQVKFADSDLVAENFDSVNKIVSFVSRKTTGAAA
ncbi:MAG TPA: acyl carrier protein [Bacteroidetes bacterium]|jgi:acyl carrier protein|nr:acyl carrier protein [Bacteroidota bacterium]